MDEIEKLKKALIEADRKGDTEAALLFAEKIKALQPVEVVAEPAFEFSAKTTAQNIPTSAAKYASSLVEPFLSPVETAKNIGNLALGTAEKLVPGRQQAEAYPEAIMQYGAQKYGSQENFLKSLQADPVGILGDLSAVMTGGGMMIPKVGGMVSRVGAAVEPLNIAKNVAGYGVSKLAPTTLAPKMYESAAKFSTTLSPQERAKLTETALEQQLMPTAEGVAKAQSKITDLGNTIDTLVDTATQSGASIPASEVFKYLNDVRSNLGGPKLEAAKDLQDINKIASDFSKYLKKIKKETLTPQELQEFKTDAYKRINYDRGSEKASIAKEETYKAMSKAAKESLETQIPEIGALNRQQGALLELLPHLQRSAGRIENRDFMGIGGGIKATGGQALAGDIGATAGLGQSIFEMPKVKSKAALSLYKKQKQGLGMFTDNSIRNALIRQMLSQQGQYNNSLSSLLAEDPFLQRLQGK